MKHYGDISKLSGYELPIVDVIVGGSPCQDLSVAGGRAGLAGERSGLFMEQIRLVKEMRERDVQESGRSSFLVRPRYLVWENVAGAFSSTGGNDFKAVLEEIVKVVRKESPTVPVPKDGWPTAGCISGVGDSGCTFSIAWRLHDAQYWGAALCVDGRVLERGTPQRRKRIALVADFGGLSAPEVLFEREGLRGNLESCEETRQGITAGAESSVGSAVAGTLDSNYFKGPGERNGVERDVVIGAVSFQERAGKPGGGKGILLQPEHTGALSTLNNQSVYSIQGNTIDRNAKQNGSGISVDIAHTLDGADRHGVAIPIEGNGTRQSHRGDGYGKPGDPCFTLNGTEHHGVAYGIDHVITTGGNCTAQGPCVYEEVEATLKAGGPHAVAATGFFDARGNGGGQTCPTITGDHQNRITDYTAIVIQKSDTSNGNGTK